MIAVLGTLMPGFAGHALPDWLADRLRAGLGGVCLFGGNIRSRAQLVALVAEIRAANPLAVVAIDEEGGDVTRLFYDVGSPYPGNAVLGRLDDLALTEHVGRTVGWQLRLAGIDLDLAPDADVNSNPLNPVIGTRSFGADPHLVARHTAAWVQGLQSTGVAASVKHFPGHGDTELDSHLAMPIVRGDLAELRQRELVPFVAAIAAGARTIMTSHILLPDVDDSGPATFSPRILQSLLRDELGFDGVIVSDALDMAGASGELGIPTAAARALAAGCDLLCIGTDNSDAQLDDIVAAVEQSIGRGELPPARVQDAAARVAALAAESHRIAAETPVPAGITADDAPPVELTVLAGAIESRPGDVVQARRQLIALRTVANIAVGVAPWGPSAAGADVVEIGEGESIELEPGVQPVLVGLGVHRHPWVRALIAQTRAAHPDTIVVDMGWPDEAREHADVVTWGASRAMGAALLDWLERSGS
ncbi:beta-N-acetylhexosaminidase [Microcella sp.]|uniref:beta-N-acetylhexosaminidase n=1 Tax=Microcella sp. TaxID=1913979 RepID=UPI003F71F891